MGFLCQLSERLLRVLAQHDNGAVSMGTPVSSTGAQLKWRPFLGTLLGCCKRVPRPLCENRNAKLKNSRKCHKHQNKKTTVKKSYL